jgi:hypothetical protein
MSDRKIEKRSIAAVYVLSILTLGIYSLIWTVKSKRDINALGGDIPTSFLLIVPFANIYWLYKYSEAFSSKVKKDDNKVLWFCVNLFAGIITPFFVQSELNKIADKPADKKELPKIAKSTHKNITKRTAA